ncbi:MAG: hypothetical protein IJA20_02820 [Methanocorpusculum sp.]|nr:hypothetical protein [Methanocorpusculum sp.]
MSVVDVNVLVEQWRTIRKQRLELDDLSKKLKNGPEAELRAQILMWLDSQNLPGVKTQHGTVSRTKKSHLEIRDIETFLQFQFGNMATCQQEGKPLTDALVMQKTPLKSGILEHVQQVLGLDNLDSISDEEFNKVASTFGIERVSTEDITFKS